MDRISNVTRERVSAWILKEQTTAVVVRILMEILNRALHALNEWTVVAASGMQAITVARFLVGNTAALRQTLGSNRALSTI